MEEISYHKEISLMMFAFGDSHKPNPETVSLVEKIVLSQLRTIVQEALKYSSDCVSLSGEELVFLMRHNKQKMRRFIRHLHNKFQNKQIQSMQANQLENIVDLDSEPPKCKIIEFIEHIDETGEFTDLSEEDDIKLERQVRADRISQALDEQKYLEFAKARCVSFRNVHFVNKSLENLAKWVDPRKEVKFNVDALNVLAYYAYETVAEITDYALLVRNDKKAQSDPFEHLPGSYYTATMFNRSHRFEDKPGNITPKNAEGNINPDHSKVYSSEPPISIEEINEVMRRIHTPQAGKLNFGGKLPATHYLFAL